MLLRVKRGARVWASAQGRPQESEVLRAGTACSEVQGRRRPEADGKGGSDARA